MFYVCCHKKTFKFFIYSSYIIYLCQFEISLTYCLGCHNSRNVGVSSSTCRITRVLNTLVWYHSKKKKSYVLKHKLLYNKIVLNSWHSGIRPFFKMLAIYFFGRRQTEMLEQVLSWYEVCISLNYKLVTLACLMFAILKLQFISLLMFCIRKGCLLKI